MKLAFPKETMPGETRIAVILQTIKNFLNLDAEVFIESGLGTSLNMSDQEFQSFGAIIEKNRKSLLKLADIVLQINPPVLKDLELLKTGCIHISFLDPFKKLEIIQAAAKKQITLVSMEMIPRISRAQKMDALSSQTNLAGYAAVILAASKLRSVFPMMMTAAGTMAPTNVFVVGVGVAGLQAIATAKRLGARVEAFDTRPSVAEQVQSLGAKFIHIDLGATEETKSGHAQTLTSEQLEKQRQEMTKICAKSNIIITTAQLFGKKAPVLITLEMIKSMMSGSVIIDMAASSGGNVEGVKENENILINDILLIGETNLPSHVALSASQMYSMNLFYFLQAFWDKPTKSFILNIDDEILQECVVTHAGSILNSLLKN